MECVNHDLLQPYPVLHEKPGKPRVNIINFVLNPWCNPDLLDVHPHCTVKEAAFLCLLRNCWRKLHYCFMHEHLYFVDKWSCHSSSLSKAHFILQHEFCSPSLSFVFRWCRLVPLWFSLLLDCIFFYWVSSSHTCLLCAGDFVAHIKFTVLLMPNGSDRITSHPLQELRPTKTIDNDPEIKAWLALGTKTKKKGGGKKKKGRLKYDI